MGGELFVRQNAAEQKFLEACQRGRPGSAWMITGPTGIGKGDLAVRIATYLLTGTEGDADSLDVAPDSPIHARIAAGSEPGLRTVRVDGADGSAKRSRQILVDDIREMQEHFRLASIGGKPRIAIIDSADDLNRNAANALLKDLEEPPDNAFYFLTSSNPLRLPPTIRSRCRILPCRSHSPAQITAELESRPDISPDRRDALGVLADGSIGMALHLHANDGIAIYEQLLAMLAAFRQPESLLLQLVDRCQAEPTPETFEIMEFLARILISRLAHLAASNTLHHAVVPGEGDALKPFVRSSAAAAAWSELHADLIAALETARRAQLGVFEKVFLIGERITGTARTLVQ